MGYVLNSGQSSVTVIQEETWLWLKATSLLKIQKTRLKVDRLQSGETMSGLGFFVGVCVCVFIPVFILKSTSHWPTAGGNTFLENKNKIFKTKGSQFFQNKCKKSTKALRLLDPSVSKKHDICLFLVYSYYTCCHKVTSFGSIVCFYSYADDTIFHIFIKPKWVFTSHSYYSEVM